MNIDDLKKDAEKQLDKISYYKEQLEKHPELKYQIRPLLVQEIRKERLVKTDVLKRDVQFKLSYDSLGEGLEPIYFWLLDFMRDKYRGLSLEVSKSGDDYEASVSSGFFGDIGQRTTRMQEQAMKMMQTINTIVRSLINLLYDLKEFELRIEMYEKAKSKDPDIALTNTLSLKQIWMDNVDVKRGRGSINMLTQQLQFVTLRDAFMSAKDAKDVDVNMDLNERVRRILKARVEEFLAWKERSEKELKTRYNIEKNYAKSQVASLKLYAQWTKPYLIAAKRLGMKDFSSPDIVNAFSNMVIELSLFGKESVGEYKETKYYACIEVILRFRTLPYALRGREGMQYVHGGRTDIEFKTYSLTDKEINILKEAELDEGLNLIEDMVGVPLDELRADIEHFLKDEKKEDEKVKKRKIEYTNPLTSLYHGFKDITEPLKSISYKKIKLEPFKSLDLRDKAASTAKKKCFVLYDVYKKTHGMLSW